MRLVKKGVHFVRCAWPKTTFSVRMMQPSGRAVSRREKGNKGDEKTYPFNRGDIPILVTLLEQEIKAASPAADLRRLAAIRGKLGDMVCEAPEMSKEEAQQFRQDRAAV